MLDGWKFIYKLRKRNLQQKTETISAKRKIFKDVRSLLKDCYCWVLGEIGKNWAVDDPNLFFGGPKKTRKKHWFQKFKAGPEDLKSLFTFMVVARPSVKKVVAEQFYDRKEKLWKLKCFQILRKPHWESQNCRQRRICNTNIIYYSPAKN